MSALYDGWDLSSLLACLKERTDGVVALCRVVLDYEDAGEDARELAEEVPVSYTHLDVYKRQTRCRPATRRCGTGSTGRTCSA